MRASSATVHRSFDGNPPRPNSARSARGLRKLSPARGFVGGVPLPGVTSEVGALGGPLRPPAEPRKASSGFTGYLDAHPAPMLDQFVERGHVGLDAGEQSRAVGARSLRTSARYAG